MNRLLAVGLILVLAPVAQAQNLLINGDFEGGSGTVYYDGFDPDVADDEPGWEAFLGAADGSYVLISPESDPLADTRDLDMANSAAGGGIKTAMGSRPAVTPLATYRATVATDNYFAPSGAAYFIDWFDGGGSLLSSVGGPLVDPAPLTYAPYTQVFAVTGAAPAGASTAGVRFESGNPGYAGLAADFFTLSRVPEPGTLTLAAAAMALVGARRRRINARSA